MIRSNDLEAALQQPNAVITYAAEQNANRPIGDMLASKSAEAETYNRCLWFISGSRQRAFTDVVRGFCELGDVPVFVVGPERSGLPKAALKSESASHVGRAVRYYAECGGAVTVPDDVSITAPWERCADGKGYALFLRKLDVGRVDAAVFREYLSRVEYRGKAGYSAFALGKGTAGNPVSKKRPVVALGTLDRESPVVQLDMSRVPSNEAYRK